MKKNIYRQEYPNPQFERNDWVNLNGEWDFEFDHSVTGHERDFLNKKFTQKINVPFAFESKLSGINKTDFCDCVWYRKNFILPEGWDKGKILLRFGAVDYYTKVYVNNQYCGFHRGGMTSFCFDITDNIKTGENIITLCIDDKIRSGVQPSGKQSLKFNSHGCSYTRTTGIWQTVWLEHIDAASYITGFRGISDIDNSTYTITVNAFDAVSNAKLKVKIYDGENEIYFKTIAFNMRSATVQIDIPKDKLKLWQPGSPFLYGLVIELQSGMGVDKINSYFGMRSVTVSGKQILINNKPIFQRLVLDQGFYPDGIWTAPSDEILRRDIELSMEAGFNGARLHQKIFEPRFLYWADKLGYLVWSEHGNWGMDYSSKSYENFIYEYFESMERDINHPSVIGWCPFNETEKSQHNDTLSLIYKTVKAFDPTRPVIDTSGWIHTETDVFDVHDYDQNPETFKERYAGLGTEDGKYFTHYDWYGIGMELKDIKKLPYFVSEFGGTWWSSQYKEDDSWGYGDRPKTIEEFYQRFEGLVSALLENENICAFCYTQLTDVEQEQNGIFNFDRTKKFDSKRLHDIIAKKAAYEK